MFQTEFVEEMKKKQDGI